MAPAVSPLRIFAVVARWLRRQATTAPMVDPLPPAVSTSHPTRLPNAPVAPRGSPLVAPPSEASPSLDYFISYTGVDREWAAWIAWQLEDAGYTVVLQEWDFRPGNNFVLMMDRAMRAQQTVIVLSNAFLEAGYTQPEWARAIADDPQGLQRRLIPVRISPCEVTGLLKPVIYVDLVALDAMTARRVLLDGVRPGRAKPTTEPRYPGGVGK